MQESLKILVIRFSSIGDIVLTSPVVRCLKQQLHAELHFVTKNDFVSLITNNPNIDKIYSIQDSVSEIKKEIQSENYDYIIDLHCNIRSSQIKKLGKKSLSYNKHNFKKFLLTTFGINLLQDNHTIDRYLDSVLSLGVKNDNKGLDFFFSKEDEIDLSVFNNSYVTFAIGGSHFTKILPTDKIIEICKKQQKQIVLIGGKEDDQRGQEIVKSCNNVVNACGKYSINQSAYIVKNSDLLITHDTGMMHIASAFRMKIYSVFGGTHPSLGFYPYLPNSENKIIKVNDLNCSPCHRYGKSKCPKGHFNCMNKINVELFTE